MKVFEIESSHSILVAENHWQNQVMKAKLEEGEDPVKCSIELSQTVLSVFGAAPLLASEQAKPPAEINLAKDRTEILIENAETIEELLNYKNDAERYGLKDQFDKKVQLFGY